MKRRHLRELARNRIDLVTTLRNRPTQPAYLFVACWQRERSLPDKTYEIGMN